MIKGQKDTHTIDFSVPAPNLLKPKHIDKQTGIISALPEEQRAGFFAREFTFFGIYFLALNFLAILTAITGLFYFPIFLIYLAFGIGIAGYFFYKNPRSILDISTSTLAVVILTVLTIIISAYFSVPSVFSGRDQGSFSLAAISLADKHSLLISFPASEEFFKIYGPGRALNFPGFDYIKNGQMISQFPVGYTSWLAVFYSIFGSIGLTIANGIAFLIFSVSFYHLIKIYTDRSSALLASILVLTCFPFFWFLKFTLSENLALAFLWFGILQLVIYLKDRHKLNLSAAFLSFLILAFGRLEAWFFILMAVFVIYYFLFRKNPKEMLRLFTKYELSLFGLILLVYLASLIFNFSFYLSAIKGLFFSLSKSTDPQATAGIFATTWYVTRVFFYYSILNYLAVGLLAIAYLLIKRKKEMLVPFIVVAPSFFYLVNPSISLDHPWMLRRYLFAVVPAVILYTMILLHYNYRKQFFRLALFSILLICNLAALVPFLTVTENKGLLDQTRNLADSFSERDLILVDRLASGSGWSMMAGPMNILYGKQAVYFFNPEDAAKIDSSRFENIYLIIPDISAPMYKDTSLAKQLVPVRDYEISTDVLTVEPDKNESPANLPVILPEVSSLKTHGKIYKIQK